MVVLLRYLAKYNQWANEHIISWYLSLNDEQREMKLVSSFQTIKDTILHIAGAEKIWYDRLIKIESPQWLPTSFSGDHEELIYLWRQSSKSLVSYTESLEDNKLLEVLKYNRLNGQEFYQPIYHILSHVFNHSTFHRGQIITMLRQTGFSDITSTDLINYFNEFDNE
jgi:uncharacterized damage-inducible protein DinB